MNAPRRGQGRFATVPVVNRTEHKVTATWDGVDEEWEVGEIKHLQVNIAWHCVNRTVLSLDPRSGVRECMLGIIGLKDDDGNEIEVTPLTKADEATLRAGGSLIPLEAMAPPEGFVPGEDGQVKATTLALPRDVRYERDTAPEITNAARLDGGKRFVEPRPGWNAEMERNAAQADEALSSDIESGRLAEQAKLAARPE